jgi:hypothetical protein
VDDPTIQEISDSLRSGGIYLFFPLSICERLLYQQSAQEEKPPFAYLNFRKFIAALFGQFFRI